MNVPSPTTVVDPPTPPLKPTMSSASKGSVSRGDRGRVDGAGTAGGLDGDPPSLDEMLGAAHELINRQQATDRKGRQRARRRDKNKKTRRGADAMAYADALKRAQEVADVASRESRALADAVCRVALLRVGVKPIHLSESKDEALSGWIEARTNYGDGLSDAEREAMRGFRVNQDDIPSNRHVARRPSRETVFTRSPAGKVNMVCFYNALSSEATRGWAKMVRRHLLQGRGGNIKGAVQTSVRDQTNLTGSIRVPRIARGFFGRNHAEYDILGWDKGRVVYRNREGEVQSFQMGRSYHDAEDFAEGDLREDPDPDIRALASEVEGLTRGALKAMGYCAPEGGVLYDRVASTITDGHTSRVDGHVDTKDKIPESIVGGNARGSGVPYRGGDFVNLEQSLSIAYGPGDVLVFSGARTMHAVTSMNAANGMASPKRHSLTFFTHSTPSGPRPTPESDLFREIGAGTLVLPPRRCRRG